MVKLHEITVWPDVGLIGVQRDLASAAVDLPGDGLVTQAVGGVFGDQDDVLVFQVQGMSFGLGDETLRVAGDDVGQLIAGIGVVVGELLTQVVSGKADSAASVFLLHKPQQVGGVADLGLDLLLAVPEVVVGDHGDNHPAFVAGAHLERASAVVELFRLLPAHAVAALPRRCIVVVGKSEFPFGQFC